MRRRAGAAACLALLTLAVFGRTIGFGPIRLDDPGYVFENPRVLEGPTPANLAWAFTTFHRSNWHPLTWVSLQVDAAWGGGRPAAFHAVNVGLHAAATLALFGLLLGLTTSVGRSTLAAALFAVHPLRVESVAWISERKDVLSTLLLFLALWAYVSWTARGGAWRYGAGLAATTLGLLAKPMLVTVPVLLVLLDIGPLRRVAGWRGAARILAEKIPFAALAAASAAVTLVAQSRGGALLTLEILPLTTRLANAAVAIVAYLGKTVWPSGLALPYPYDPALLTLPRVGGAVALLVAATVVAACLRRSRPYLAFGWAWYLVTLVPVLGVVQVGTQAMADRYTYVPLVGIFVAAAWSLPATWIERRTWRAAVPAAIVLALAAMAWVQAGRWSSSRALFGHAVRVTRGNAAAHNILGLEAFDAARLGEAMDHYREALAAAPRFAEAHGNLAVVLARLGRLEEAAAHYREALRLRPLDADTHANLGLVLDNLGRAEEAEAVFREALRLDPRNALAGSGYGLLLARVDRNAEALPFLHAAVAAAPADAAARVNLAGVLIRLGRTQEARGHLEAALGADPGNVAALVNLGVAMVLEGRPREAEPRFVEALRLDPGHAAAAEYLRRLR